MPSDSEPILPAARHGRRARRPLAVGLFLVALVASLGACDNLCDELAVFYLCSLRDPGVSRQACIQEGFTLIQDGTSEKSKHAAAFLKAAAKRRTAPPGSERFSFITPPGIQRPNVSLQPVPVELVPPFRVEITIGLCDPLLAPDEDSSFGLTLRPLDATATDLWLLTGSYGPEITVRTDFSTTTSISFPGADQVDLALEHDGTDLIGFARDHDVGGDWTEIARDQDTSGEDAFLPAAAVIDMPPGSMVTLYGFRVAANGEPDAGQAPERRAVRCLADAASPLGDAFVALDTQTPDPDAALAALAAAGPHLEDAMDVLGGIASGNGTAAKSKKTPEQKAAKKAARDAKKALKQAARARKLLEKKGAKKAKKAAKQVGKAINFVVRGGDRVLPDDLRDAIGGLTFADLGKR